MKEVFTDKRTEKILMCDPHVGGAVMFGRSKFFCGVLVQPEHAFDPEDHEKMDEFLGLIWCEMRFFQ